MFGSLGRLFLRSSDVLRVLCVPPPCVLPCVEPLSLLPHPRPKGFGLDEEAFVNRKALLVDGVEAAFVYSCVARVFDLYDAIYA